ncbi:metallophosphoesterase family protein [Nocardioides jiangxiensis]|uniref:Metallophosphoesterase family protein n=1 Tax=Nocardioides jiangxiensis TaxID=3064524 RepID=A0ABT9B2S9_9ACTN|nr:metallophosphoesterase family protein [Nocardioides sp. WY-20]MDO7869149.1 metallophosphoesterase family protein [Nocardioides sp. WY-20]
MRTRTALGLTTAALLTTTLAAPAGAARPDTAPAYTFAVIGDIPYGAAQVAAFPGWVDQISADPDVQLVAHLGDIKSGSTTCDDAYFAAIRTQFDRFDTPLVYTPGDNEWTDCHRPNNGGYDPYERLDRVRQVFFDHPGTTLGVPMAVEAQPAYPENVAWRAGGVTFTTAHVVGSNNGMAPWTGATAPNERQLAEVPARTRADIAQLHHAFTEAQENGDRAVVVMQQADVFDPTWTPTFADFSAFKPWVQALVEESAAFDGKVYLFDGDSHVFHVDRPLADGSPWLDFYGVDGSAGNLTRVTVDGSSNNTGWLKVRVAAHGSPVLTWERLAYR